MSENNKDKKSFFKKIGKKGIIGIIAAVVLIAVIAGVLLSRGSGGRKAYVMPVAEISSNAMNNGTSNRFSGVVEPQKTKEIQADSMKTIDEVYVKVGDEVKAGDKLFTYKIADMELDLQQLNVDLQSYYNQIDDLNEQKRYSSSQYEIQIINMQISNTQTEIQKKRNEIEAKKREMEQAYVTSPIDGVIKEINDPNSMMYTGSGAYMTIIADGEFLIKCKISEMNVSEIYQGMEMVIRSRVNENQTWKGTISSIDTGSPVNEENQGYYYGGGQESGAKYAFYVKPETPDGLLLGQHVTVESSVSSSAGYTGILLNSGFIADIESKAFVWVSKNGTLKKSYVTIGKYKADSDEYEITSGLEKDDYIAFPDETLKEGMKTTTEYIPEEEPGLDDGDFYVIPEGDVPEDDGMMIPEDGGMFVPGEEPAGGESNGQ